MPDRSIPIISDFFRKVILFIGLTGIVLLQSCVISSENEGLDENLVNPRIETLIEDGAWCWYSDPRAVYFKGKKEQIYFGYINSRGHVGIGSKDLQSGKTASCILHDTLEIDDHNVPSILVLQDGTILAFYNEHNGNLFMRKSKNPEVIDGWHEERIIAQETEGYNYTYTNPVRLENEQGRIYLFGRKVGPTRSFDHWWPYMKYSDDNGTTWSEDIILLDNEGRKNPPYLKVTTDHKSRIDFLFTDGHPKIGADVSVYHMYFEGQTYYQTNGEAISSFDKLPVPIQSVQKVYDAAPSGIRSWIWDIALKDGSPVITYARYPTEADHIYHYTYWQDDQWVDHQIVNSGSWMVSLRQHDRVREAHYSGGIVLDHQHPDHVYLSRDVNGKFEIEHRALQSDGTWTSSMITSQSSANNVRPYVIEQSPEGQAILLWMNGVYRHYTEYDTDINMFEIKY